jgi:hypothetical protein
MKLNAVQIEQALTQFEAEPIPADHPAVTKLESLFGEHTFFLDGNGLNILEPAQTRRVDGGRLDRSSCVVMNIASWVDEKGSSLEPHEPESTYQSVTIESGKLS